MNKPLAISIGLGLLVVLILFSTTYPVAFHEVAVKKRFGRSSPDDVVLEPGLQFKLPIFADQVSKYDTRLQMIESPLETIPTADNQQVLVQAYLLWQVDKDNVLAFDNAHRSMDGAQAFIRDRFKSAMLAGLSRYRFGDLLGSESRLKEAENEVAKELSALTGAGIKPVAVGISQVLFPQRTSRAVLTRMQATRETLARAERSKGQAEAQRIESEANTMSNRIMAFAQQRAAEIRAAGDEQAAGYFAQMGEHEELAKLLLWLDALEASLSERTTIFLDTHSAPMHFLNMSSPLSAQGVPMPTSAFAGRIPAKEPDRSAAADSVGSEAADGADDGESDETDSRLAERGH